MKFIDNARKKTIFCIGSGYSGNAAVLDFFRNFSSTKLFSSEFDLFRGNERNSLCFKNGGGTVWDIYCEALHNPKRLSLSITKYQMFYRSMFYEKHYKRFMFADWGEEFLKINDDFCENVWALYEMGNTEEILAESVKKLSVLLFYRLFHLPVEEYCVLQNPLMCYFPLAPQLPLFPKHKLILTHRDPRDMYVDIETLKLKDPSVAPWYHKNVDEFIETFKTNNRYMDVTNENILDLNFEDLCLHYQEARKKIMDFVGLDENAPLSGTVFFDPDKSVKNISLYKTFGNQDDIRKIEKAIPEYLYRNEN